MLINNIGVNCSMKLVYFNKLRINQSKQTAFDIFYLIILMYIC